MMQEIWAQLEGVKRGFKEEVELDADGLPILIDRQVGLAFHLDCEGRHGSRRLAVVASTDLEIFQPRMLSQPDRVVRGPRFGKGVNISLLDLAFDHSEGRRIMYIGPDYKLTHLVSPRSNLMRINIDSTRQIQVERVQGTIEGVKSAIARARRGNY